MQAVRCEACGNKALVAASSCPHCGHLFDLRDSFGELLPLTHCPTCECDYLTRDGKCKWCGTSAQARRVEPSTAWKAVGVLAFLGMAIGVWVTRDGTPEPVAATTAPNDSLPSLPTLPAVVIDTAVVATVTMDAPRDTPSVPVTPVVLESASVAPPSPETLAPEAPPPTPSRIAAPLPSATVAVPPARAKPRTPARNAPARWRSVVARDWVTVRAAPRHGSRLLGSLGPDTRIQLGESRSGWVRVRIRGLSGWVHEARLRTRSGALARR